MDYVALRPIAADAGSLDAWITAYDRRYMAVCDFTPRTRVEYRRDLTDLACFLEARAGVTTPTAVSKPHLRVYLSDLTQRGLSTAARRRRVASVRSFFAFLTAQGVLQHDPAAWLDPPARDPLQLRVLSPTDCARVRQACAHSARDTALITLFLTTGLRLSEAAALTLADLGLPVAAGAVPLDRLRVRGRRGQQRLIPLPASTATTLTTYLERRPRGATAAVFVSKFRRPLSERAIRLIIATYLTSAGIRHASVHSLRHTYAVQAVAAGLSSETLQARLGHRSPKSTQLYRNAANFAGTPVREPASQ